MSDNKTLLDKADLALSDLASSGKLNPEQSSTFTRLLIEGPNMLNEGLIRFEPMRASSKKIEKINFGKRILRAMTEGTALDTAAVDGTFNALTEATARAKPTFSTTTLTAVEVGAEVRLTYDTVEDAIDNATAASNNVANTGPGGLHQVIIEMLAPRVGQDLQDLAINGDTSLSATDPYLATLDGWVENARDNGSTVDVEGATISKAMLKSGLLTLPNQYKDDMSALYHFVSKNNKIEYADTLADRATGLGDRYLTDDQAAPYMGTKVFGAAKMADTEGLLTHPKNLIFGMHRDISIEFDKLITSRQYVIMVTMRIDFEMEDAGGTVLYTDVGTPA